MKENTKIVIILGISIAAISIASISIMTSNRESSEEPLHYMGVTKEFWLFNSDIPDFNETKMNMPHDVFSMQTIHVIKGDTVLIHFFNLEEAGGDTHDFVIGQPYNISVIVYPGENKTFSFNATTAGIFTYECTFHQPTMRGQLIVDEPSAFKD
ncbi:MAG: cupredoxin domain-containing protein [Nitrosotalea sp.]